MPRKQRYQWSLEHAQDDAASDMAPSRSSRKRDSASLQRLGESLTSLSESQLDALPLSADLREAIGEWRRIPSREAKRRQLQYIGRLMREEEHPEAISDAVETLREREEGGTLLSRQAEMQREALVSAAPEERPALCARFGIPPPRIKEVENLAARAANEREYRRPPHAFRALFRLLREIGQQGQD